MLEELQFQSVWAPQTGAGRLLFFSMPGFRAILPMNPRVTQTPRSCWFLTNTKIVAPRCIAEAASLTALLCWRQVGVRVEEEDVKTGARHHCCSAYLTFVSVLARPGTDGRPARRMKRVAPTLPTHTEIFEAADEVSTSVDKARDQ